MGAWRRLIWANEQGRALVPGKFLGTVGQDPSDSKPHWFTC